MKHRSLALSLALLALGMSGCAREPSAPAPATAPPAAQAPATPAPATPAPAAQAEGTQAPAAPAAANEGGAAQESSGDTAAAADPAAGSLERLAASPAAPLPAGKWKPGVNYTPLVPAQPTNVGAGKVEVLEVFWYGCPHCYDLEPFLASWNKSKPAYIEFVKVPVMWSPVHQAHAKLFYTLKALGREDLTPKVFDDFHNHRNEFVELSGNTVDEARTLDDWVAFGKAHGIAEDDFRKAAASFTVNTDLQRAEQLTTRYRITGVPAVIVNGKYKTDVGMAGGHGKLLELINDLAASEQKH